MQPNLPKRQLKLELPADPSATYANTVMISHNKTEVIFDFIQILPNDPRARVQRRIVMTPMHAKMFLQALQENVNRYEGNFRPIEMPQRPESLADQLFKGVMGGDDESSQGGNPGGQNE